MIKAKYEKEKLGKYVHLFQGIVKVSISVLDAEFNPVIETKPSDNPVSFAEKLQKKLPEGQTTPVFWHSHDETTEVAAPVFYDKILFAYVWIGDFYFQANANPHENLMYNNRPVYDQRSISDIMAMLDMGVRLFLRDIYDVAPNLQESIDQYLFAHLNEKITLHMLSSALNTDITVLRAFLADELNCNLPDYLREKRIQASQKMLAETDLPLPEIAQKIGISEKLWIRLFKKQVFVTPEEYRKNSLK